MDSQGNKRSLTPDGRPIMPSKNIKTNSIDMFAESPPRGSSTTEPTAFEMAHKAVLVAHKARAEPIEKEMTKKVEVAFKFSKPKGNFACVRNREDTPTTMKPTWSKIESRKISKKTAQVTGSARVPSAYAPCSKSQHMSANNKDPNRVADSANTSPKGLKDVPVQSTNVGKTPLQELIEMQTRIDKLLKEDDLDEIFISQIEAKFVEHRRRKEQEAFNLKKQNEALPSEKPVGESRRTLTPEPPEPPKNLNNPFRRSNSRSGHMRPSRSRIPKHQLNKKRSFFPKNRPNMGGSGSQNCSNFGLRNRSSSGESKKEWRKQLSKSPRDREAVSVGKISKTTSHKKHPPIVTTKKNKQKTPLSFPVVEDDSLSQEMLFDYDNSFSQRPSKDLEKSPNAQGRDFSPDSDDYLDNWENSDWEKDSTDASVSATPMRSSSQEDLERQMFMTRFANPSSPLTLHQSLKASTENQLHQHKTDVADKTLTPPQFIKSVKESGVDLKSSGSGIENKEIIVEESVDNLSIASSSSTPSSTSSTDSTSSDSNSSTSGSSTSGSSSSSDSSEESSDVYENFAKIKLDAPRAKPRNKGVKRIFIHTKGETLTPPLHENKTSVMIEQDIRDSPEPTTPPPIDALVEARPVVPRLRSMSVDYDCAGKVTKTTIQELLVVQVGILFLAEKSTKPATTGGHNSEDQQQDPETMAEQEIDAETAAEPNEIFDASREAVKLTICHRKLHKAASIFENPGSGDEFEAEEESNQEDTDFTEKLRSPVEVVAIVEQLIETKDTRHSCQQHSDPLPAISRTGHEPRPRSPNSGYHRERRRSTSRSRPNPQRRQRLRSLSVSPPSRRNVRSGRYGSSGRRRTGNNNSTFATTQSRYRNAGQRSRTRSRSITRQSRRRRSITPQSRRSRNIAPQRKRSCSITPQRRRNCSISPKSSRRRSALNPQRVRSRRPVSTSSSHFPSYYSNSTQAQRVPKGPRTPPRALSPLQQSLPPLPVASSSVRRRVQQRSFLDSRVPKGPRTPPPALSPLQQSLPPLPVASSSVRRSVQQRSFLDSRVPKGPRTPPPALSPLQQSLPPLPVASSSVRRSVQQRSFLDSRVPKGPRTPPRALSPQQQSLPPLPVASSSVRRRVQQRSFLDSRVPKGPRTPPPALSPQQQSLPPLPVASSSVRRSVQQRSFLDSRVPKGPRTPPPALSPLQQSLPPLPVASSLVRRRVSPHMRPKCVTSSSSVSPISATFSSSPRLLQHSPRARFPSPVHDPSSYYSDLSSRRISLDTRIALMLNDSSTPASYSANYAKHHHVPMSISNSTHSASSSSHKPAYSNISTIGGGEGMSARMPPRNVSSEFGNVVSDQHSRSVLKDLPKATVAVQKRNFLEIVPTSEMNSGNEATSMAVSNGSAQPPCKKLAKCKKSVGLSWRKEVHNRHLAAEIIRKSRENKGSSNSILKIESSLFLNESAPKEEFPNKLINNKKVFFMDGIFPNQNSGDEDSHRVNARLRRKMRQLRNVDVADIPPPPPPPGTPTKHLEQPTHLRPPTPTPWLYFHYDPVVQSMYVSLSKEPVPPRLLNPKALPPSDTAVANTPQVFAGPPAYCGATTAENAVVSNTDLFLYATFNRCNRARDRSHPETRQPSSSAANRRDNRSTSKPMPIDCTDTENSLASHKSSFSAINRCNRARDRSHPETRQPSSSAANRRDNRSTSKPTPIECIDTENSLASHKSSFAAVNRCNRARDRSHPKTRQSSSSAANRSTIKPMPIDCIHTENSLATHKSSIQSIPTNVSLAPALPQTIPHHTSPMSCVPPAQRQCVPIGFMGMRINNLMRLPPSPPANAEGGIPTHGEQGMPVHIGMQHSFSMPTPTIMPQNGDGQPQQHPHLPAVPYFSAQQQPRQYHLKSSDHANSLHMHHVPSYPVQPPSHHTHPVQFVDIHHQPPAVNLSHVQPQQPTQFFVKSIPPPPVPPRPIDWAAIHGSSADGTGAKDTNA